MDDDYNRDFEMDQYNCEFPREREGMGKNITYYKNINGKPEEKILSRRGRDNYSSKASFLNKRKIKNLEEKGITPNAKRTLSDISEKKRILNDRQKIQRNYGRRVD